MRLRSAVPAALALAAAVAAAVFFATRGSTTDPAVSQPPASGWRGLVGTEPTPVAVGKRAIVLLRSPSLADRVRAAGGVAATGQEERWTRAALLAQQRLLTQLAFRGVPVRPEIRFTRVVNGFSAVLDASAVAALERNPAVLGVYAVHAAFPALLTEAALPPSQLRSGLSRLPSPLQGFAGSGVTIALLDTAVDLGAPFLRGHVLPPGIDLVGGGGGVRTRTDSRTIRERHGTEVAGILVGKAHGVPAGVAPAATVLPIRVAGWQRDAAGHWSVYARTDQLLAGLDRAVDPNGDGDAHDAARIALVPLSVPFAAFSDGPLALAAAGARDLDTLVVAPAGNDGPAGPAFGAVSGPGGAPAALTVGTADLRSRTSTTPLVVRAGLHVVLRRDVPVLGAAGPSGSRSLPLAVLEAPQRLRGLVDRSGFSKVAGRAVLVFAGSSPRLEAMRAILAGAALVLLAGSGLPAGGLGLDETAGTPVLGVPASLARRIRAAGRAGAPATVSVGPVEMRGNELAGRVASFSSWGLAFGGNPKPDLSAPGVGIVTADPRSRDEPRSRLLTVSGSSAAAAVLAGEAAALIEARPSLDAAELQSVLAGTARPLLAGPAVAQGTGLADLTAAATAEVATEPASLSFGRRHGDGWTTRILHVRNLSTRTLTLYVGAPLGRKAPISIQTVPRRLVLRRGATGVIRVRARVLRLTGQPAVLGTLAVAPIGSQTLRVPWAMILASVPRSLLGRLELSHPSFKPSTAAPAVVAFRVGSVGSVDGRTQVEPVLRLDLELRNAGGKPLGLLARLRDVLPGRYAFGLTGRGPNGRVLRRGIYRLRVVAWPAAGGQAVRRSIRFRIA